MRGSLWAGAALFAMALAMPAAAQHADQPGDATTTAALPLGQDVAGVLSPAGDTDWYRLRVQRGQRYTITMEAAPADGETALDTLLVVYSADGQQLAFNDDAGGTLNSALTYAPAQDGEVFVEARGFDPRATGGYRLRVEASVAPPDDFGADNRTRGRLTAGWPVTGNLEVEGDTDWFRLSVSADRVYRIALNGAEENGVRDPLLRVLDSEGQVLAYNDDHNGLNSYLEYRPARTGTVFVEARAFADIYTGAYTLSVESERQPRDAIASAASTRGRVALGGSVDGLIDYAGDRDWYRIRLEQGQTYRFSLNSSGDTPLDDPLLRVYDARGNEVALDDDGGGNLNALLEFTAPASGAYYLEAAAYADGGAGTYTLSVRDGDIPADATTDVTLSAEGDYREGVLSPAADRDWYRIDLQEGQALRISVISPEGVPDALNDPYLIFYGPDGQEVGRDDDGGGNLNAWFEYQATAAGPHYLEVRGYDDNATGRYLIGINQGEIGADPDGAEAITPAVPRMSTIGTPGDVDWFAIEMIEGRPYRINVIGLEEEGGLADPYVRVYGPEGQELASDDDGGRGLNAYLYFASPTGGPHFVAVSSFNPEGTGRYGVVISDTDVPGHIYTDEVLDAAGDSRTSRIEMPGDLDYYGVQLEGGVTYQIDVRGHSEHPLSDPYLAVLTPENERVTADDDSGPGFDARVRFTPRESGVYFLQASGVGGATGGYQISIVRR